MMPGMIMLWHGSVASIPSGWHMCNGEMGTPDLTNRFIRCAESDTVFPTPGAIGGSNVHTHSFAGDGHTHDIEGGTSLAAGEDFNPLTSVDPAVGITDSETNVPMYYTLCYIMKL